MTMNRFSARFHVLAARAAQSVAALGLLLLLHTTPAPAQVAGELGAAPWSGSWGAAPAGPPLAAATTVYSNQTFRLIVHTSTGGSQVRVRFSNELSPNDLVIGAAHVALRYGGSQAIVAGSDRVLSFGGAGSVLVRAGTQVLSDPVSLGVPALSDLAVSLYLPGQARASTLHPMATQNSYVSPAGNYAGAASLPVQALIETWPFLTEVDVSGGNGA